MAYIAKRSDGRDGAPLVLTFHGTGATEEQFHDFAGALFPGSPVVSPRGDVSEMGAARFFRRTGEGVYDMDDLGVRTSAMVAFIRGEKARTRAPGTIGLGYSNGANILASVALSEPGTVDAMILMHPLIPWSPDPQPGLAGREVLITAGRADPICPAPMTRAFAAYLGEQGARVSVFWHDGGHEIAAGEIAAIEDFARRVAIPA